VSLEGPEAEGRPSAPEAESVFKDWLRRLVSGAAELRAFDAGEIDAVMDPTTGSAVLLPPARAALQSSSRLVLSTLEALPYEVCVLDATGTVLMTNRAWRTFASAHAGAGLGVRDGVNFLAACRAAAPGERAAAAAVAAALRLVLTGTRDLVRCQYVCDSPRGACSFVLTIAGICSDGTQHAVLTREHANQNDSPRTAVRSERATAKRLAGIVRTDVPNRLLAALPAGEYERLLDGLDPVKLTYGEVLNEPGEPMRHVYFPSDCLVSLLTVVEGHHALEVGLVGREGMVGTRLALGISTSPVRALVQGTGTALRMKSTRFAQELQRSPELRQTVLRFADSLMGQVTHTAACNRFHMIEARLARWLLMTRERLPSVQFRLTHEFLADMLGVRRVGVTAAAGALQRRKLIHYRRGIITILDQKGLEAAACSCYRHVRVVELRATG
jgi:CRP-like cAMP-binding protein